MEFLDYEQARRGCRIIEHKIKFEDAWIDEKSLRRFYLIYARTSVLLGEMSKAIELTNEYKALIPESDSEHYFSIYYFMKGTCYMYQGKLEKAVQRKPMTMHFWRMMNCSNSSPSFCPL